MSSSHKFVEIESRRIAALEESRPVAMLPADG